MKFKTISFKLFLITALFSILFITATMFLQSFFFENFYHDHKITSLKSSIEQFKKEYRNTHDLGTLTLNINRFEDSNNAKIIILSSNGTPKYLPKDVDQGDELTKTNLLLKAVQSWSSNQETYSQVMDQKKTIFYEIKSASSTTSNAVIISPVALNSSTEDVLFVVSSLQPIGEAAAVIKEYFLYIYISVILLIAILSLIYSKVVSKPLRNINLIATKMSELDFSSKCIVNSRDEIGNLSSTLNFLSDKLDTALTDLQSANLKLKVDIEKERNLETMRKEFIAGVSHELKSPISLIEGYAEGLKDNIVEGKDKDYYFDVIIDEAQKMAALVNDMLDLSQLETGNFKLIISDFNLHELLSNTIKKYSNSFKEKNLSLNFNSNDRLSYVIGDSLRIEQVIKNFITNTIRYTPENGAVNIDVIDEKQNIKVEIENEGVHLDKDELSKIWEKFYKVDKSRLRDVGGIGLGLSIVKNILGLHKSSFGVLNTEKGTKFYFTLKKSI